MHGDYHPPVTIGFPHNALSCRQGVSAAGSALLGVDMQLRLTVNGCVPGFEYQLIAEGVCREADNTVVLKTWDRVFVSSSGNLDLNATFMSPAKCERCRFNVVLYDVYASLSLDERKVSASTLDAPLCPDFCASAPVWSPWLSVCAIHAICRVPGPAAEWQCVPCFAPLIHPPCVRVCVCACVHAHEHALPWCVLSSCSWQDVMWSWSPRSRALTPPCCRCIRGCLRPTVWLPTVWQLTAG